MAAEVSSMVILMNGIDANESAKSTVPITRDLLGSCSSLELKDLDLDLQLQVPYGWEKRLDLKSGKLYIQRSYKSSNSLAPSPAVEFHDLNSQTTLHNPTLSLFDESGLDLKLLSPSSLNYHSVCTLDKVKSALVRAEKETSSRKRTVSVSTSNSSESFAAGCPNCLMYVMISKSDPICPRCSSHLPILLTPRNPVSTSIYPFELSCEKE